MRLPRFRIPDPLTGYEKFWAAVVQAAPPTLAALDIITVERAVALQIAMAPLMVYLTGNSPKKPTLPTWPPKE